MDNFTRCDEYFESLKIILREKNISTEHYPYPNNDKEFWKIPDSIGYIKMIAYAVIMLGGLLGNVSVILTVALVKSVRNAMNMYVANLAVADALICIVCMLPHAISHLTKGRFLLGEFMCKVSPFTQMTCLACSVLILCAISCDRFMAVFRPLQSRTTEKRTSIIIVMIWIVSMAVASPFLCVKTLNVLEWADFSEPFCAEEWPLSYYRDEVTNTCEKSYYLRKIYYIVMSVTLFILPVVIMLAAYAKILHKIWTSKIPGERSEANIQAQSRSKQKVLKMVFVVLIVFVICWTPLQVTFFVSAFELHSNELPNWYSEFEWFSYYFAYSNSFLNPFIYGQYNKDFRNGICLILCCCRKKRGITRFSGENFFTKSVRSMSTTISTLRSGTQEFFSKRMSRNKDPDIQVTAV